MANNIVLNGITWNHSRGITPLLAVSQRFHELHPHIEVKWSKRTLQEFADFPIEKLTEQYDLLIIDHPWVGCADATRCVLPLEQHLDAAYLQDQLKHSVGYSHKSYEYNYHQWALAIDAATPVASYRKDLLSKHQQSVPHQWDEVLQLAKDGKVAVPAIPIDLLMNFYTFCIAVGEKPFQYDDKVVSDEKGIAALELMLSLYSLVNKKMFTCNPIAVAELMSTTNDYWYCPFAYGYSNYARNGYAQHLLHYTDTVFYNKEKLRTTVGGTGLAVSAFSKYTDAALAFAAYAVAGHKTAWEDALANQLTHNYFLNTLPALERGYIRPRYNGYLHFQDHAGNPVQDFLSGQQTNAAQVLKQVNKLYVQSKAQALAV